MAAPLGARGKRFGLAVRFIFGIMCLLLGTGLLLCRVESSTDAARIATRTSLSAWVRTVDGWERTDGWFVSEVSPPRLHPLVVAAGQGLVSLLGLAAFSQSRSGEPE